MRVILKIMLFVVSALILAGCKENIPMQNLGIDDFYYIYRMQKLKLNPAYTGEKYRWILHNSCPKRKVHTA